MTKSEIKWRTFLDKIDKVFNQFKNHIRITSEIADGRHRVIFCKTHDVQWFEKLESAISRDYELCTNYSYESEPDRPFERKYEFILPKLESKGIDMGKVEIQEECRIPGTDIILEKGDVIQKLKLSEEELIERKVIFDEPLFKYIVEYRSEPMYGGRINYYHTYNVQFESRFDRQLHQFGINAYFEDSGRSKYPSIGFSDLHKRYDMEEWLKVLNTLYSIMKKIADYEKTYVRVYY